MVLQPMSKALFVMTNAAAISEVQSWTFTNHRHTCCRKTTGTWNICWISVKLLQMICGWFVTKCYCCCLGVTAKTVNAFHSVNTTAWSHASVMMVSTHTAVLQPLFQDHPGEPVP